jgi:hypothetical protein
MWSSITSFVDKYLVMGLALLLAAAVVFGGWQTWSLSSAKNELITAQTKITTLEGQVKTKELQLTLKDASIKALENRQATLSEEQDKFNNDMERIDSATDDQDGDVADVLCRAVSGTDCLRNNGASKATAHNP